MKGPEFTLPSRPISPFYPSNIKLPRKLKKRMKKLLRPHWDKLSNGQRLWSYLDKTNPKYASFIINKIIDLQP